MDMQTYMGVYTAIHNLSVNCIPGWHLRNQGAIRSPWSSPSRSMETLYGKILGHLERQVSVIREASNSKTGEALLEFFVDQWQRYELAAQYINHLCRYLNRHWVRREIDEGRKNTYDVYTLHLIQWKTKMFEFLHERAMDSVLSLVESQRNGEEIGYRVIKKYVDSFGKSESKHHKTCPD